MDDERTMDDEIQAITTRRSKPKVPLGTRIFKTFFQDDLETVVKNTVEEEVIPGFLDFVANSAHRLIDESINSGGGSYIRDSRDSRSRRRDHDYTSHSKKSSRSRRRDEDDDDDISRSDWGPKDYPSIPFDTRQEAEDVIRELIRCKKRLPDEAVSVGNLYSAASVVTTDFTVNDWGWEDIDDLYSARAVRGRDGKYHISICRPVEIS